MSKATVAAPANIAFVKYWGARDLARALPYNPSISMTLARAVSHSTVEAKSEGEVDEVLWAEEAGLAPAPPNFAARVLRHLAVLRRELGSHRGFRVATRNSFPSAAGMASSASGFAALTLAVAGALERTLPVAELSRLARLSGSGSAARSVLGGYVEWPRGEAENEAVAELLAPAEHWQLCDLIAIVERGPKEVSSLDGHQRAESSPYFQRRLELLGERLAGVRQAIADRDLDGLGPIVEEEAIDLHLIAMSSRPAIFYWQPATLRVLATVRGLRAAGVGAWSTMDAGPNVHVICRPGDEAVVAAALADTPGVESVFRDHTGNGPHGNVPPLF